MSKNLRTVSGIACAIVMAILLTPRMNHAKSTRKYVAQPCAEEVSNTTADHVDLEIKRSFNQEVEEASKQQPVVVDFWGSYCGPCKKFGPVFEQVSKEFAGKVKFVKVQTDGKNPEAQTMASRYNVRGIPAILFFKDGKVVHQTAGSMTRERFVQLLKEQFGV